MKKILVIVMITLLLLPGHALAVEKVKKEPKQEQKQEQKPLPKQEPKQEAAVKVPNSVVNISKENTYPNSAQDIPYLEPSKLAKDMLKTSNVRITNPELIRLLNESSISASKVAFWYRARIFLGQYPLSYQSTKTSVNWEYQQANTNRLDNRGGKGSAVLSYSQVTHKRVTGGLTAHIPNEEAVKKMMIISASQKTELPLAFQTNIGAATKKNIPYNIAPKQVGLLYSYVPAVNERGRVAYGEVYIVLKGGKRKIEVQNVTQQGIGAWIPVQDHLSFRFNTAR
ncbi:YfkD family protein [Fictibacillus iocasae]|uniref:YfkD family protein n=1 Tax=Fictibacillus iocasae TaxID=2715437 RepID=A0ABW2NY97_9BACL